MRILHVINTLNPASGGTAEAAKVFATQSHGLHDIATLDSPSAPWMASSPARIHGIGPGFGKYGYSRPLSAWLKGHAATYDASVVHGVWQYHGLAVWRTARTLGIPYFVFPHGMLDPYFREASTLKHLKKLIYWPMEKAILRDARAVFFTSAQERENAFSSFGIQCHARLVPLGVPAPDMNPADQETFYRRFSETRGKRLLLFLGRVHPKKGVDLLISAFSQQAVGATHLVIAGPNDDESYSKHLRAMLRNSGLLDAVTFAGMLTGPLKSGALQAADAFVLPSHQENFGVAVAEALAFGVPVLLSNKVNIGPEIEADGAGFVAPDTLEGTAQLLARWIALTGEERQRMRISARTCFEQRFRAESAFEHFVRTIRECGVIEREERNHSWQASPA